MQPDVRFYSYAALLCVQLGSMSSLIKFTSGDAGVRRVSHSTPLHVGATHFIVLNPCSFMTSTIRRSRGLETRKEYWDPATAVH